MKQKMRQLCPPDLCTRCESSLGTFAHMLLMCPPCTHACAAVTPCCHFKTNHNLACEWDARPAGRAAGTIGTPCAGGHPWRAAARSRHARVRRTWPPRGFCRRRCRGAMPSSTSSMCPVPCPPRASSPTPPLPGV